MSLDPSERPEAAGQMKWRKFFHISPDKRLPPDGASPVTDEDKRRIKSEFLERLKNKTANQTPILKDCRNAP